jgi:type II secretory pathway pseudopilin PulG
MIGTALAILTLLAVAAVIAAGAREERRAQEHEAMDRFQAMREALRDGR